MGGVAENVAGKMEATVLEQHEKRMYESGS